MDGRWLAMLALVVIALAGCSDDGDEGDTPGEHDGHGPSQFGGDTSQVTEAPQWALGDWWSYTDSNGGTFNIVVADDVGSDWLVLSNDMNYAWYDWQFDISFIGPMSKSGLTGQQGGDDIRFLQFPLEHGNSWNSDWDGESRHIVAHAAEGGKWHIVAHAGGSDGDPYAEYVYDPAVEWMESLIFYNLTNGDVAYEMELTGSGSDFTGTAYQYTAVEAQLSLAQSGPGMTQGTFDADEGQEVQIDYAYDCGTTPGQILFGIMEPGEDGSQQPAPPFPIVNQPIWGFDQACPGGGSEVGQIVLEAQPGTWRADGMVANSDGSYDVVVSLRTLATYAF